MEMCDIIAASGGACNHLTGDGACAKVSFRLHTCPPRRDPMRYSLLTLLLIAPTVSLAAEPPPNIWVKTDAVIEGRRWDVPLGYDPVEKRFLVLGGRTSLGDYKKPRSYDVLSFDPT